VEARLARVKDLSDDELEQLKDDLHDVDSHLGEDPDRRAWQLKTLRAIHDEQGRREPPTTYAADSETDRGWFRTHYVNRAAFKEALEKERANPKANPKRLAELQERVDDFEEIVAEDIATFGERHGDDWIQESIAEAEAEIAKRAKGGRGGTSRITPPDEDFDEPPAGLVKIAEVKPAPKTPKQKLADTLGVPKPQKYSVVNKHTGQTLGEVEADTQRKALLKARKQFPHGDSIAVVPKRDEPPPPAAAAPRKGKPPGKPPAPPSTVAVLKPGAYRGYLIRQHEVDGSVWIEKDGHMILRDAKSIENARRQIDELIDGPPAPPPTPLQKLGEKLGIRKPRKPRKGTVEAAEREAIESGRKGVKRGSEEFPFSQDNPEGLTGRKLEALRRKQDAARRAEQAKADKEIAADLEREGNDYGSRQLLEDVAAMGGLRIVPKKPKKHWTQLPGGGPKRLEESGEIERLMEARPTMAQKYKNKKRGWGIWTSKTFDKVQPDVLGGVKGVFATEGKTPSELAEGLRGLGWRIESGDQLLAMMETANNNLSGLFKRKRPLWDKPVYGKDVDDILGNRRGEISAELVSAVAGGAGGALVGGTQGDTTQERIQYALLGGLAGAGGSAALARFLGSRMASRAAQAAAGSQAKAGTTVEHRVPGPQGTFDTAPGMNRTPSRGTKTVTPTGTYSEGGPSGRVNVKTKEARRAAENEVIRFMGGDVPAARRMPKAQREELGFERFPEEQRDGIEDLVVESLGQGNYERGLDVLEAHRRGRQPNVRTKALGAEMALSTKDKLAPGFNMAASGHSAYMDAVASTQDDIRQVARKIKDTGGTDADLLELHQLKQRWSVLFLNYMGLRSEAGRALQIYKAGARIMPHEFRLVRELLDRGRLRKDTIDFADIMTNLSDDPVKAFQELRKHEQRGLMARIGDYYMSNILSGIKTQERNFLGNASRLVSRLAVKLGTGGLDALQSLLTGSERQVYSKEVLHELQGGFAGAQKAWEDFTETLKYGFSPTAIREGLQNTEGPVYLPKTEMPGGGRNPLNYPGRLLEAADRLFRNLNGSMELYGLTYQAARKHAEREGLEGTAFTNRVADLMTGMRANPSGELKAIIAKAAERAVFQEDPGTAANLLISLKKVVPPLQYVIPFVRTVSNIMKQGAEHTPVGFLMKRARQSDDLREQTIARGEAAMGTLAMLPIAYYAATGNISGSGPKDPAKRAALYEEGWRPNSVRIGNRWVSYTLAQPFSVPLSIIANGFEAWQEASQDATEKTKAEKLESIAAQTMLRVGKSALDQSFLSGLGDLVKAINDPERASSGFFARVASGFVPLSGLQRNVAQFIDPTVRQPEGVIETLKTGIPGASFTVQPRLTRFGEAAQRERQSAVVVPEMTPVTTDPVALELSRLGLDIGLPTDRINFSEMAPGARQLTGDESFTLRQTRGRATRVILDSVMNMPGYKGLPDVLKAELLRRALRDQMGDVNDVARIALQGGRPDLLQNLSAPLESLAASTYRETR
jgi:hypothetical protein